MVRRTWQAGSKVLPHHRRHSIRVVKSFIVLKNLRVQALCMGHLRIQGLCMGHLRVQAAPQGTGPVHGALAEGVISVARSRVGPAQCGMTVLSPAQCAMTVLSPAQCGMTQTVARHGTSRPHSAVLSLSRPAASSLSSDELLSESAPRRSMCPLPRAVEMRLMLGQAQSEATTLGQHAGECSDGACVLQCKAMVSCCPCATSPCATSPSGPIAPRGAVVAL